KTIYNADWSSVLSPSRLHVVNVNSLTKEKQFDFGAEFMAFHNDKAYLFTNDDSAGEMRFLVLDTKTLTTETHSRFENIPFPYGLALHPISGDTWIADAGDFKSPGKAYRFNVQTGITEIYEVGVAPNKFAFKGEDK